MKAPRAVRSVKFSAEPMDIVAFAEHEQAFHLVDARNFGRRQTLHASSSSTGISGMAFTDSVRPCHHSPPLPPRRRPEVAFAAYAVSSRAGVRLHF